MKCGIRIVDSIRERKHERPFSSDFQKRTAFLTVIKKEKKNRKQSFVSLNI
jgi:hypothetical protein